MRTVVMLIVLGLALGACKKGSPMMSDFEAWSKAACECKDKACAEKQKEEFNRLESKYEAEFEKDKAVGAKIDALLETANECLEKFDIHAG